MSLPLLSRLWDFVCTPAARVKIRRPKKSAGVGFCRGITWLLWFSCETGFALDFSGPLQDVQAWVTGNQVTYQAFDPQAGSFVQESTNMPPGYISNPTTNGGVVAWLAGSTVYYEIYDPGRS